MARVTTQQWREWVQANDADDPLVFLVEISHPSLSEPIRVSSDMTTFLGMEPELKEPIYGTVCNGVKFYAQPFSFTVPDTPGDSSTTKASFSLQNVSQEYTAAVRNLTSAPRFRCTMVLASSPDTVQQSLPDMWLTDITLDASTISGELSPADFRTEPWPKLKFYPSGFQGLFS